MLSVGLGPIQANATNTVALWPGQLTSIAGYLGEVKRHVRLATWMAIAGLIGGSGGAIVLLNTPATTFLKLVPWLLLVSALIFALSRPATQWLKRMAGPQARWRMPNHESLAPNPRHRRRLLLHRLLRRRRWLSTHLAALALRL